MTREEIRKDLKNLLSEKRFEHTLGVEYTSACLAMRYGADMEKARMAVKTAVAFFFISIIPFQNLCGFSISTAKAVNTYTSS